MSKKKNCIDFYGEKLKIGDEVIPMLEEAALIGIGGIISKIEYSERYDNHYITITNNEGKVLLEGVDARCYTTQERYNERENQEYVYFLIFYNKKMWPMTTIPLTNRTDSEYVIPDETCFVSLEAQHLVKRQKSSEEYVNSSIYNFIIDDNVELYYKKDNGSYYLLNLDTHCWSPINNNYKILKNDEELKKYIKNIIEYFNNADLTYVNNDVSFAKNKNGKEFEKNLIHHLKH